MKLWHNVHQPIKLIDEKDIRKFVNSFNIDDSTPNPNSEFYIYSLIQGVPVQAYYSEYELKQVLAIDQNNPSEGTDVTEMFRLLPNAIVNINHAKNIVVYGVITTHTAELNALNDMRIRDKLDTFSSPIECIRYCLNNHDTETLKNCTARFYAYELVDLDKATQSNSVEQNAALINYGFSTPTNNSDTIDETNNGDNNGYRGVSDFIFRLEGMKNTLQYAVDGAVIVQNNAELYDTANIVNGVHHGRSVWLYTNDGARTQITNIEWKITIQGHIYPTIHLKPTNLYGELISHIDILDTQTLKSQGDVSVGTKVVINRPGSNPPYITKIESKGKGGSSTAIDKCPFCGADIITDHEGEWYCSNINCKQRLSEQLKYVMREKCQNLMKNDKVKNIIEKCIENGLIKSLPDAFRHIDVPENLTEVIDQNELDAVITELRDINLTTFIYILGIPYMYYITADVIAINIGDEDDRIDGLINILKDEKKLFKRRINVRAMRGFKEWINRDDSRHLLDEFKKLQLPNL